LAIYLFRRIYNIGYDKHYCQPQSVSLMSTKGKSDEDGKNFNGTGSKRSGDDDSYASRSRWNF